jgi:two-component system KDP operon response regulator KdpE
MMTQRGARILVVDDERAIRRFLGLTLEAHGYQVLDATSGEQALRLIASERPDLVVLDLGLPDLDGVQVITRTREWSDVPIVVLSVRDREADKVRALDSGADDYLTKPFGQDELLARLRVALRRSAGSAQQPVIEVGDLAVDVDRRRVTVAGADVALTPTEYDILKLLAQHAGKVLTHRHILRQVWGPTYEDEPHVLRVNISNLRRKIEPDPSRPRYVVTEPGVGYRMAAPA